MNRWFFPSWSGDFRLEAEGEDRSVLTVVNPTPAEIEQLGRFLGKARAKKWVARAAGISPQGESTVKIDTDLVTAGKVLLGRRRVGVLTAVKSVAGVVTMATDDHSVDTATSAPEADKAVSVRRPTLCCPVCVTGPDRRASDVLQAFCSDRQWAEWERSAYLHAIGNLTGRKYRIVHRHHPLAKRQTKIVWDLEADTCMHCYDWSVPPAEEVLAVKLTLEHREDWIRNDSGAFGGQVERFLHPLMPDRPGSDGLSDASLMRGMGLVTRARVLGIGIS